MHPLPTSLRFAAEVKFIRDFMDAQIKCDEWQLVVRPKGSGRAQRLAQLSPAPRCPAQGGPAPVPAAASHTLCCSPRLVCNPVQSVHRLLNEEWLSRFVDRQRQLQKQQQKQSASSASTKQPPTEDYGLSLPGSKISSARVRLLRGGNDAPCGSPIFCWHTTKSHGQRARAVCSQPRHN